MWQIEARAFRIRFTPFTHNFWVLVSPDGQWGGQLHGLAVDPITQKRYAFGTSHHLLHAVSDAQIPWSMQLGQKITVCEVGSEVEIYKRWQTALVAIPLINALNLAYPDLWQHPYRPNSNSIFSTFGLLMGFSAPETLLPTWAIGSYRNLMPEIAKLDHRV